MKITAPAHDSNDVETLCSAGADELYCGIYNDGLKYINGRPEASSNLEDFNSLSELVRRAEKFRAQVFFCVNAFCGADSFAKQKDSVLRARDSGVTGFIIADPSLIIPVRAIAPKSKIVISTLAPALNSHAARFFRECGADRIVMDRLSTLDEIAAVAAKARACGLETEVFIRNITCTFVNAYCGLHEWFGNEPSCRGADGIIRVPCRKWTSLEFMDTATGNTTGKTVSGPEGPEKEPGFLYCGLCSLLRLKEAGVSAVKIVGRRYPAERIAEDITLLKKFLSGLENGTIDEKNAIESGRKLHAEITGRECVPEQCFYYETSRERRGL